MTAAATKGRAAERVAFTTSRLMEYVSEKELGTQIGSSRNGWPLSLTKELIDNALDASEAADLPPTVNVVRGDDYFEVQDEGPGIPPDVVEAALDFSTRTSSNSKYVSPTRGQLGNALKCVFAAPAVLFPGRGAGVTITARGVEHRILITPDRIAQAPAIDYKTAPVVKTGTSVRVDWPGIASWRVAYGGRHFYNEALPALVKSFAAFNPHASIRLDGELLLGPAPVEKWDGCDHTSAHWYDEGQLADLIAAHVHRERQGLQPRSVRDFVVNFHGLTGSSKAPKVLAQAGLSGKRLADLVTGDEIDGEAVGRLLAAMREAKGPPDPQKLGVVGKARLLEVLTALDEIDTDTFSYHRAAGADEYGRPYVVEAAFGCLADEGRGLSFRWGVNWSPSLSPPHYIDDHLDDGRVHDDDPVAVLAHVVTPRAAYADAAKSHAELSDEVQEALAASITKVTARWAKAVKKLAREEKAEKRQLERVAKAPKGLTLREAAFRVMERAHALVVGDRPGAPAQARQVMYRARNLMQHLIGSRCWKHSDTFTQGYLPDYVAEHPEETATWNVVYDERGEMLEPHGGVTVDLGTLCVREYLATLTGGRPRDRYHYCLLVEKEGFRDLIEHARIANRFDVALAWTKGMSTTAARELVDGLSGLGVTTLILHDFDSYGLSIAHTISHDSRRYKFKNKPLARDVGLRLADVQALGLEGEPVEYRGRKKDPRALLAERDVPKAEQDYLVRHRDVNGRWHGRRVELNELTNEQFVAFVERKLTEAFVAKVVPDEAALRAEFEGRWRSGWVSRRMDAAVRKATEEAYEELAKLPTPVPGGLAETVRQKITGTDSNWRQAVLAMASSALSGAGDKAAGGDEEGK